MLKHYQGDCDCPRGQQDFKPGNPKGLIVLKGQHDLSCGLRQMRGFRK